MKIIKYLAITLITFVAIGWNSSTYGSTATRLARISINSRTRRKSAKIFSFNVPVAWASVLGFLIALYYGFLYLKTKKNGL